MKIQDYDYMIASTETFGVIKGRVNAIFGHLTGNLIHAVCLDAESCEKCPFYGPFGEHRCLKNNNFPGALDIVVEIPEKYFYNHAGKKEKK